MKTQIVKINSDINIGTYGSSVKISLTKKPVNYFDSQELVIKFNKITINNMTIGHVDREENVLFIEWDDAIPFNIKQSLTAIIKKAVSGERDVIDEADVKIEEEIIEEEIIEEEIIEEEDVVEEEIIEEGVAGEEDVKNTDEVAETSPEEDEGELHGGENASKEVEDSPNAAEDGEEIKNLRDSEAGDGEGGGDGEGDGGAGNGENEGGDNSESGNGVANTKSKKSDGEADSGNNGEGGDGKGDGGAGNGNNGKGSDGEANGGVGDGEGGGEVSRKFKMPSDGELKEAAKKAADKLILEADKRESLINNLVKNMKNFFHELENFMKEENEFERLIGKKNIDLKPSKELEDDLYFDNPRDVLKDMLENLNIKLPSEVLKNTARHDGNAAYSQPLTVNKKWYMTIADMKINKKKVIRKSKKIMDKILFSLGGDEESPRLDIKKLIKNIRTFKSPYNAFKKEIGVENFMLVVDTSPSMAGFTPLAAFAIEIAKADNRLVVVLTNNNWPYVIIKNKKEIFPVGDNPIKIWEEILEGVDPKMGLNINDLDGIDIWEEVLQLSKNTKWVLANNYRSSELAKPVIVRNDSKMPTWKTCKHYVGVGEIDDVLNIIEYNFAMNKWRNKNK